MRARTVLLATGARDVEPDIAGLAPALKCGQVRFCPVCDGYETTNQRVAILGREVHGLREAAFVAGFGNRATWLSMGCEHSVPQGELAALRDRGVAIDDRQPRHDPQQPVTPRTHCTTIGKPSAKPGTS